MRRTGRLHGRGRYTFSTELVVFNGTLLPGLSDRRNIFLGFSVE